jgi:hypothetical protein
MHIFPTTQNLALIVRRKLEQKATQDTVEAEIAKTAPAKPPASITAPARKPRKPAAAPSA